MPQIPTPPRRPRANLVTTAAVVLALLLACVWLHSAAGSAPAVPAGLAVPAPVAAPVEARVDPAAAPASTTRAGIAAREEASGADAGRTGPGRRPDGAAVGGAPRVRRPPSKRRATRAGRTVARAGVTVGRAGGSVERAGGSVGRAGGAAATGQAAPEFAIG